MVIPVQVTRSISIYGDPAPSDQKTRSIAIYGDPAGCPGGGRRSQNYQAAQVGIGAFKVTVVCGDPAPSSRKYRDLQ